MNHWTAPLEDMQVTAETLRAVLETARAAIVALDENRNVTVWNPEAERILGYSAGAVLGQPLPVGFEVEPGFHEREYRVSRADGTPVDILCSVAPLPASEDGHGGHVLTFTDHTERKRLQRKHEQSQQFESLGVLAGGVAHDFNNLLTGILGNASLGMDAVEKESELHSFFEDILHAGERAAALTQQLLAYAGMGRFIGTTFDLSDLAQEIVSLAQVSIPNKNVTIVGNFEAKLPSINADRNQLRQALLNLITNGAEAVDQDSPGIVQVSTRLEMVSDGSDHDWESADPLPAGPYALLEVRDSGSGMDAGTRSRIFEPFFSTKFTGRGLGLAAVQGIVRQHGGAVSVQSAPGMGSTFRVLLPLNTVAMHPAATASVGDLKGSGLILVVDDEYTVRNTVRRSLERWDFGVVLAENGQSAVEAFQPISEQVRAIILDLTMPVMGGEEALAHLRKIRRDVPVVLTSGYSEADAMRRMCGKDVDAFLQKPFSSEQLGWKLATILRPPD